jgi:hypothetical protein
MNSLTLSEGVLEEGQYVVVVSAVWNEHALTATDYQSIYIEIIS